MSAPESWDSLTREEIDCLWHRALSASVRDGEKYTRYHFAALLLEIAAKKLDARFVGDNNREDFEARRCAAVVRALKPQGI